MIELLAVDDEPFILESIRKIFASDDIRVRTARTLAEARSEIKAKTPDVILLDIRLGEEQGLDLLQVTRDQARVGVIILSVMADYDERVRALDGGADDFVCKPFHKDELRSRVFALARRLGKEQTPSASAELLKCEDGELKCGSQLIHVTSTEYKIVELFVLNSKKLITKQYLLNEVWSDVRVTTKTLDTHINNIRQKLHKTPFTIKNKFGKGFMLTRLSDSEL